MSALEEVGAARLQVGVVTVGLRATRIAHLVAAVALVVVWPLAAERHVVLFATLALLVEQLFVHALLLLGRVLEGEKGCNANTHNA